MIDARISQLNVAGALSGDEYIPITQLNATTSVLETLYTNPQAFKQYIVKELGDSFCPVGSITSYAGSVSAENSPSGWLLCNGQSVLREAYPKLFEKIGTVYGSDSSTTFKVPNLKGRVVVGYCDTADSIVYTGGNWDSSVSATMGSTGGEFNHLLNPAEIPLSSISVPAAEVPTIAKQIYTRRGTAGFTDVINMNSFASLYGGTTPPIVDLSFHFGQCRLEVTDGGQWIVIATTGNNRHLDVRRNIALDGNGNIQVKVVNGGWGDQLLTVTAYLPGASVLVAQSTSSNIPFNVMQPYIVMNYIIKH
jgi:microcystin-dependent protein